MKTSINLKTSKMKNKYLKLGMMAAVMLSASIGFAQTAPADAATNAGIQKDAGAGESVRVIDNKGTIKYLQTNNGITSITSTATNNTTTTTWQLGGTLVDATTITTSATGTFTIDGEEFNLANTEVNASTAAAAYDAAGYTLLVRDEITGQVKKMLATDLITGGQAIIAITTDGQTVVAPAGLAATTEIFKISVYRNGNKLRGVTDYNVTDVDEITLIPDTGTSATSWNTIVADVIEVQWVN